MTRGIPSIKEAITEHIRDLVTEQIIRLEETFNCKIENEDVVELLGTDEFYEQILASVCEHRGYNSNEINQH